MRDGISRPELDATVKALAEGKPFDEIAKTVLLGVDPKVVEVNRESLIKLAVRELSEQLVTPERKAIGEKLQAELKPAAPAAKGKGSKTKSESLDDIE